MPSAEPSAERNAEAESGGAHWRRLRSAAPAASSGEPV